MGLTTVQRYCAACDVDVTSTVLAVLTLAHATYLVHDVLEYDTKQTAPDSIDAHRHAVRHVHQPEICVLLPTTHTQSACTTQLVHGQVTIISVVSVGLFVCLFVCAEFFSAVFDRISIKLGHMLYVWV